MSVSSGPESRLRHWCSSRYLRISPLHRPFHSPLPNSSLAVSNALPQVSRGISHSTCQTACMPFKPNKTEQRLPPPYYRGCWHGVSRGFLGRYCQTTQVLAKSPFLPPNRALRLASLLHPRGVAASGFRPLRKILSCASRRGLGLISIPVRAATLSGRLPIVALVSHYLTNKLIGRGLILRRQLETEATFHLRGSHHKDIMRY